MERMTCSECKKGDLIEKHGDYETVYVDRNGQSHTLKVPGVAWLRCELCGEEVLESRAVSAIESARRRALGLLTPGEIRTLRNRLGKSQAAMSELLGIGEKTYCRWESGSYVQSEASDRYLRLILMNQENVRILEEISMAESKAEEEPDDVRNVFTYLKDVHSLGERGRLFSELMTKGELQAAH